MREIKKIIVHCSAGNQQNTAQDIVAYHTRPVSRGGRGWKTPGYHYIIEADGKIVNTWPEEQYSNGVRGHNSESVNVCYTGGVNQRDMTTPEDTRTEAQKASLLKLLRMLKKKYPGAEIYGHRDFAAKACPSFDARKEYAGL